MKRSILLAAAALLTTSAEARTLAPSPTQAAPDNRDNCAISMIFGSFGPGIDRPTLTRVERRLRTDRRVRDFTRHPWGREGEVTLCIHPVRFRDARRLGQDLQRMIPARPRGPIELHLARRLPLPR